jgi:ubiquinone/menaquinone biosynthesis C-methylase UbiE
MTAAGGPGAKDTSGGPIGQGSTTEAESQRVIDSYFEKEAPFWKDIYEGNDVYAVIHQRRRATALTWMEQLELPAGSRILEVGCGAGLTAVQLARDGFEVDATDSVPAMVELTRQRADEAGVSARLRPSLRDVHALDFEDGTFDAVVALGVIPWLHSPGKGLQEMARILKPGGYVIVNADNAARLTDLMDPRYNPALTRIREAVKRLLVRAGVRQTRNSAPSYRHSRRGFEGLLYGAELQKVKGSMIGFGPFTFWGRRLLPNRLELKLHHLLQSRADRGVPGIRSAGAQYLVLARKGTT